MNKNNKELNQESDGSNLFIGTGVGLGAFTATTTALAGVGCAFCVIAAPALIGAGIYQKYKTKKDNQANNKNK